MDGQVEDRVESIRQTLSSLEEKETLWRIKEKLKGLEKQAEELDAEEKIRIVSSLERLERQAREHGPTDSGPTLDEVEKEIDEIYGDQSDNSTYYFSRRDASLKEGVDSTPAGKDYWKDFEPEGGVEFGNQSDNSTWYFGESISRRASRLKSKSEEAVSRRFAFERIAGGGRTAVDRMVETYKGMDVDRAAEKIAAEMPVKRSTVKETLCLQGAVDQRTATVVEIPNNLRQALRLSALKDVQEDSDETYGDQSKNETFYVEEEEQPDEAEDFAKDGSWYDDEPYLLQSQDFDEFSETTKERPEDKPEETFDTREVEASLYGDNWYFKKK